MKSLFLLSLFFIYAIFIQNAFAQCDGCPKSYANFFEELNHETSSFFEDGLKDDLNLLEICNPQLASCQPLNYNCFNVVSFCFKNPTDLFLKEVNYTLTIQDPTGKTLFTKKYSIKDEIKPNDKIPVKIALSKNIKTRFNFLQNPHAVIFEKGKVVINKPKVAEYIVQKGIDANNYETFLKSIEMAKKYDPKIEKCSLVVEYKKQASNNNNEKNNIETMIDAWNKFQSDLKEDNMEQVKKHISFPLYYHNGKKGKDEVIKESDFNKNFKHLFTKTNKEMILFEDGTEIYKQACVNTKDYPNLTLNEDYYWFVADLEDSDGSFTMIFNNDFKLVRIEF